MEGSDREPIALVGRDMSAANEFLYLRSLIPRSGRVDVDVDRSVAHASQAFGALRKTVFLSKKLSLTRKGGCIRPVCSVHVAVWCRMLGASLKACLKAG